jgi:hypothetical protein
MWLLSGIPALSEYLHKKNFPKYQFNVSCIEVQEIPVAPLGVGMGPFIGLQ